MFKDLSDEMTIKKRMGDQVGYGKHGAYNGVPKVNWTMPKNGINQSNIHVRNLI